MKPRFVSAVAVLFCCVVFAIVGLFAYSRYMAAQEANAAFQKQLINGGQSQQPVLGARMPEQLPARAGSAGGEPSASPQQ